MANVTPTITSGLLAALQDGEWHRLSEFVNENQSAQTLTSTMYSLKKQGYIINVRRATKTDNTKEYQLVTKTYDYPYDLTDIAILAKLYKCFRRNKQMEATEIFLDLGTASGFEFENSHTVFYRLKKLSHHKFVGNICRKSAKGKQSYHWKILPKGVELLKYLADKNNSR